MREDLLKLPPPYPEIHGFSLEKLLSIPTKNSPINLKTIVNTIL